MLAPHSPDSTDASAATQEPLGALHIFFRLADNCDLIEPLMKHNLTVKCRSERACQRDCITWFMQINRKEECLSHV